MTGTIGTPRQLFRNNNAGRLRSPAWIDPEHEKPHSPLAVIALQGPNPSTEFRHACSASVVASRIRSVEGLLSIAEAIPGGVVLIRAESFDSPDDLRRWRAAQPVDWITIVSLSANRTSLRATLTWLARWPLPVFLESTGIRTNCENHRGFARYWGVAREPCRMLPYLAPRLMSVSPIVAAHLVATYASPHGPNSLKQLAAASHMSERHIRRLLLTAGIRSSYLYFAASRVLRAYADVSMGELSVAEIARRHGFGNSRTARSQWLNVTGTSLEGARGAVLTDAKLVSFAKRIVEQLTVETLTSPE